MGDASKECLHAALTAKPGSSAVLVTGGAKESMLAHPGVSKVVLATRVGFIKAAPIPSTPKTHPESSGWHKVALATGACLVPMWGFGENNVYENMAIKSAPTQHHLPYTETEPEV